MSRKPKLTTAELASGYFQHTESILQAMIDSTLRNNLPVVFVLNRPFLHACYKGTWLCVVKQPAKMPDNLLELGKQIDAAAAGLNKYAQFITSPIQPRLSSAGKIRRSNLVQRLHTDVHSDLSSIEYYLDLAREAGSVHAAKELCVVAHMPFYRNLRIAMAEKYPSGPVTRDNVLADPLVKDMLRVYDLPE